MATKSLTDYERKRLENIKRNDELLASLNIKSKLSDLSASSKRHRVEAKSYKLSPDKKVKSETPIVIRRSLRSQGKAPDSAGLQDDFNYTRADISTPAKRGRGRPPKAKDPAAESLVPAQVPPQDQTEGQPGSEVKRGRGRPKKDPKTVPPPPSRTGRPRGRPRKVQPELTGVEAN